MKTYKHKKSGMIATLVAGVCKIGYYEIPACLVENSSDWEEVVEQPEYVECITHNSNYVTFGKIYRIEGMHIICDNIKTRISLCEGYFKPSTKEAFEKQNRKPILVTEDGHFIYEENELVWAVRKDTLSFYRLNAFMCCSVKDDCLFYSSKDKLDAYVKQKTTPILVTEDGVNVFANDGQKLYGVSLTSNEQDKAIIYKYVNGVSTFHSNRKWFADEKKAKNYLILNAKLFSVADIIGSSYSGLFIEAKKRLNLS